MYKEGNGHDQCLQHPLQVETAAVLDSGSHTVGTAKTDESIAHIKKTGGHDAGGAEKTLREGNGEEADVIAGVIQHIEGFGVLVSFAADEPAGSDIEHTAAETQQGQTQQPGIQHAGGRIDDQRGGQSHLNDDLRQNREVRLFEKSDLPQTDTQQDNGNIAAGFDENVEHSDHSTSRITIWCRECCHYNIWGAKCEYF